MPAVGFAMGDAVISVILKELGHLPKGVEATPAPVMITVFDEAHILDSYRLASELRDHGLKVSVYPTADKLGKQFKYADRIGAKVTVVLGPDEIAKNQAAIKDLTTGNQLNTPRENAAAVIHQMLAAADSP